jgi:hypothetical protein
MKPTDRSTLFRTIRQAWSRSTSADPAGWTASNPAWGQCAVTALVVQDALGGELVRTIVDYRSHYFNLLEDGDEIDLTREQFPVGAVASGRHVRDRRYVLSFPDTAYRYGVLKAAVGALDQPGRGGPGRRRGKRPRAASAGLQATEVAG